VFPRLVVQKQPLTVLEGGSVLISNDHLDISPLKQAISDLVPPTAAEKIELFFVVRETPVNGVLQVTLAAVPLVVDTAQLHAVQATQ